MFPLWKEFISRYEKDIHTTFLHCTCCPNRYRCQRQKSCAYMKQCVMLLHKIFYGHECMSTQYETFADIKSLVARIENLHIQLSIIYRDLITSGNLMPFPMEIKSNLTTFDIFGCHDPMNLFTD